MPADIKYFKLQSFVFSESSLHWFSSYLMCRRLLWYRYQDLKWPGNPWNKNRIVQTIEYERNVCPNTTFIHKIFFNAYYFYVYFLNILLYFIYFLDEKLYSFMWIYQNKCINNYNNIFFFKTLPGLFHVTYMITNK